MRRAAALLLALSLAAPACATGDDEVRVVAALFPLAWVAERVGGAWVDVVDLTPPGTEAHDATLSAAQRADLQVADVVVVLGVAGFQPDIERAVAQATGAVVDVTAGLDLLDVGGSVDPHLWLDPALLAEVVPDVAAAFAAADPSHAADFEANAAATRELLATIDGEFRDGLAGCAFRSFVTTHAAFGYLARAYDLTQVAIEGLSPESEPAAAAVEAALGAIAEGTAAPAVFAEATEEGRRIGRAVAEQAGVDLFGLSTLESDPAPLGYPAVMRGNLLSLTEGLACP
jgi:zinc transport system substrate-binding protein